METEEKIVIGGMVAIVSVLMLAQVVQATIPQPQYTCPICGAKFMTYDELYSHFIQSHPSEPIEVIWTD